MNKLEEIQEEINDLNSIILLKDKIKSMKQIKEKIYNEQKDTEKLIKKLHNFESKEVLKYNKYNINKLQDLFEETQSFDDKLEIYSQLCFKIDQIEEELFGEITNTDSEEIEFDSESDK